MLTRRDFLKLSTGAMVAGNGLNLESEETRPGLKCRPTISGPLWWCSPRQCKEWGLSGWRTELDQQRELGFDLLWLTQAPSLIKAESFPLKDLLDLCAQRSVQVILDTGYTGNWYAPLDLKKELELCRGNIKALGEQFATHPAFYAWYIPQEIYMAWGPMDSYVHELYPALTEACKKAANLPVTLSPFFILDRTKVFGDFQFNEPEEYRQYWTKLIKRSGLNVIMLQDSGEHFSYVTNEQRRPFFQAMSQACRDSGARLWGNVEVGEMECSSLEEYVKRYGRVHHSTVKDITWRSVPIDRLRDKLALAAEYSERIVSWGYREFCRPELGSRAKEWYDSYRNYFKSAAK
jgi:hypothetical protein